MDYEQMYQERMRNDHRELIGKPYKHNDYEGYITDTFSTSFRNSMCVKVKNVITGQVHYWWLDPKYLVEKVEV
jgi:hypothetical protein